MVVHTLEETAFKMTAQISSVTRVVQQWNVTDTKIGQMETF